VFTATLTQSTRPTSFRWSTSGLGADLGRHGTAAVAVDVDDRDEIDVGMGGVLERVKAPEVAHADDAGAELHPSPTWAGSTATTAIFASSASASVCAAVEDDRPARLDRERAAAHLGERPDRLRPDRGQVEAEVLDRLRRLHDDDVAVDERARAPDRRVGPLDAFDGHDRAAADDDALADVEAPDDLHDLEPVADVRPLLLGRRAGCRGRPAAGTISSRYVVDGTMRMPSASSSSARPRKQRVVTELAADPSRSPGAPARRA
jgi:hypothetical protein